MQLAYCLHINRKISTTVTRRVKVRAGALAALQAGLPSIFSRPITEKQKGEIYSMQPHEEEQIEAGWLGFTVRVLI